MNREALDDASKRAWGKAIKDILSTKDSGELTIDPDTILADIIDDIDTEVSGSGYEMLEIWNDTPEESKQYVEATFESLTGVNFYEYINKCSTILPQE